MRTMDDVPKVLSVGSAWDLRRGLWLQCTSETTLSLALYTLLAAGPSPFQPGLADMSPSLPLPLAHHDRGLFCSTRA